MDDDIKIRVATIADAAELHSIYKPYVENTAINFEYEVPSVEEFTERMRRVMERYPFLAAECNGEIVGYAYIGAFRTRAAYDWAVETTVYVKQAWKRGGVGSRLYQALEDVAREQGIINLNACIAYTAQEDEYLSNDSEEFHRRQGYNLVGEFHRCGYKYNRWYNVIWMEKHIGEHLAEQPPVKPFEKVRAAVAKKYGIC